MDNTQENIVSFLEKMASQDNRCTRGLYYYVIEDEEEYQADIQNCDETRFSYDDVEYASEDDMVTQITAQYKKDHDMDGDYEHHDEDLSKIIETAKWEGTEYGIKTRKTYDRLFLTETDAKEHLRLNKYHYSPKARTYVKHAWRAPELENFFKSLFKHFDIDSGKQHLWQKENQPQPVAETIQ